ncbi:MAG: hypothetical protein LBI05_06385 [Planctomycetaceae bacterium]|nr:hypothetical protein [Planctomycetaceae bacterium]
MKNILFACTLLLCPLLAWAQENIVSGSASSTIDPISGDTLNLDLLRVKGSLGNAWNTQDPARLLEAAQMFQGTQQTSNVKIEGLSVDNVLEKALQLALDKRDTKTIDAIGKIAEENQNQSLVAKVANSKKLAGESRSLAAPLMIDVFSTSPEKMSLLTEITAAIDRARVNGDKEAFKETLDALKMDAVKETLTETEIQRLTDYMKSSESAAIPATKEEKDFTDVLDKLGGDSRDMITPFGRWRESYTEITTISPPGSSRVTLHNRNNFDFFVATSKPGVAGQGETIVGWFKLPANGTLTLDKGNGNRLLICVKTDMNDVSLSGLEERQRWVHSTQAFESYQPSAEESKNNPLGKNVFWKYKFSWNKITMGPAVTYADRAENKTVEYMQQKGWTLMRFYIITPDLQNVTISRVN